MSRMWGTCLDHVLEVEVVTADGKINRANAAENPDLFWVSSSLLVGRVVDNFPGHVSDPALASE